MAVRSPAAREQPFSPARIGTQTPVPGWGFAPSSSAMADKVAEILQFVGSEFTGSDATAALERAGGDVEEAVAMLLEEGLFGSGMKARSRCAFSQLLFFALQEAMQAAAAAAAVVAVARIAIVPVRRRIPTQVQLIGQKTERVAILTMYQRVASMCSPVAPKSDSFWARTGSHPMHPLHLPYSTGSSHPWQFLCLS